MCVAMKNNDLLVESADTAFLKIAAEKRAGSNPALVTKKRLSMSERKSI